MKLIRKGTFAASAMIALTLGAGPVVPALSAFAAQDAPAGAKAAAESPSRMVGAITAIHGNSLTVKTDAGVEATLIVEEGTRMLQTIPGRKDLSGATPIHLGDLEVGDRVLARVSPAPDGKTYTASTLFAVKQADLAQKHQSDQESWQTSGEGGLVKSVDPAAQTVTISIMTAGVQKTVLVRATPKTITRRYAPDSIEFNDAKPAPLDRIKAGDQLRARGTRSADGSELQAEEIVSGTFRNVVATVTSVDAAGGTLTLADLVAKSPVVIKVTHDSQLRKLPPMMAEMLAMRLRNAGGQGSGTAASSHTPSAASGGDAMGAQGPGQERGGRPHAGNGPQGEGGAGSSMSGTGSGSGPAGAGEQRRRGPADLQQALSRAPEIQLSELHKGDAVMVVTTEGSPSAPATAVTLLAGVEPMLQASTSGSRSMLSSSWNLNTGGPDVPQ